MYNLIEEQYAFEEQEFTYTIPSDKYVDPENDPIYLFMKLSDGNDLPSWLTFEPESLTLYGTPLHEDGATLTIILYATDGGSNDF